MGIGLAHGVVHQLEAGVAACEHLGGLAAQDIRKQGPGGGEAGDLTVVAHVQAAGYVIRRILHQMEDIAHQIQLGLPGFAPGHVQVQPPGFQSLEFLPEPAQFCGPLLLGHLKVGFHTIRPFRKRFPWKAVYPIDGFFSTGNWKTGQEASSCPVSALFWQAQQPQLHPHPHSLSEQAMQGSPVVMVTP